MITVAKEAGFCFGVRRATDLVEKLIKDKSDNDVICTFGKLIHNESYNQHLAEAGVENIDFSKIEDLFNLAVNGKNVTLVLRTHGIERELFEELNSYAERCSHFKVVDCACPYVKKIHKIASENSGNGQIFILVGHKDHPEVRSIVSYCKGEFKGFCDLFLLYLILFLPYMLL